MTTTNIVSVAAQYDDSYAIETGQPWQLNNLYNQTQLTIGPDSKFSWYATPSVVFRGLDIPKGAIIDSASIDFEVDSAPTGLDPVCLILPLMKDGKWDLPGGRTGWTTSKTLDFSGKIRNATGVNIGETWDTPTSSSNLGMRYWEYGGQSQFLSQSVVATSTEPMKYFDARIRKYGTLNNNCWIECYTDSGNQTPGTLLGTSAKILASSVTNDSNCNPATVFTFPGSGVNVTSGVRYVFKLVGDWDPLTGFIGWSFRIGSNPVANMRAALYGLGEGHEYQNYLTNGDWLTAMLVLSVPYLGYYVGWSVPGHSVGSITTTPDLKVPAQAVVNHSSYVQGDPFGWLFPEWPLASPNGQRYWASFDHLTRAAPKFTITWHELRKVYSFVSPVCEEFDFDSNVSDEYKFESEISESFSFDSEIIDTYEFESEISDSFDFDSEIDLEEV